LSRKTISTRLAASPLFFPPVPLLFGFWFLSGPILFEVDWGLLLLYATRNRGFLGAAPPPSLRPLPARLPPPTLVRAARFFVPSITAGLGYVTLFFGATSLMRPRPLITSSSELPARALTRFLNRYRASARAFRPGPCSAKGPYSLLSFLPLSRLLQSRRRPFCQLLFSVYPRFSQRNTKVPAKAPTRTVRVLLVAPGHCGPFRLL